MLNQHHSPLVKDLLNKTHHNRRNASSVISQSTDFEANLSKHKNNEVTQQRRHHRYNTLSECELTDNQQLSTRLRLNKNKSVLQSVDAFSMAVFSNVKIKLPHLLP